MDKKMTIITLAMSDLNSFILSVLITEYDNFNMKIVQPLMMVLIFILLCSL